MFKNNWVDNEVRSLKSEIKCGKRSDMMFFKMLGILVLLLFFTVNAFGDIYIHHSCPYCHEEIEVPIESVSVGFFPDTWKCLNKKCGYVNYEGINSCALCGTKRGR